MRVEDAFKMLMEKCERLSVERVDAQREKEEQRRMNWSAVNELQRHLTDTRRSLDDHRKALKAAKVKKLPPVPKHFADWTKDDDIPF